MAMTLNWGLFTAQNVRPTDVGSRENAIKVLMASAKKAAQQNDIKRSLKTYIEALSLIPEENASYFSTYILDCRRNLLMLLTEHLDSFEPSELRGYRNQLYPISKSLRAIVLTHKRQRQVNYQEMQSLTQLYKKPLNLGLNSLVGALLIAMGFIPYWILCAFCLVVSDILVTSLCLMISLSLPAVGSALLSVLLPVIYFSYTVAVSAMAGFGAGLALASCVFLPLAAIAMAVGLTAFLVGKYYAPEPSLTLSHDDPKRVYQALFLLDYLGEENAIDALSQCVRTHFDDLEDILCADYQSERKNEMNPILSALDATQIQRIEAMGSLSHDDTHPSI
ncbi:hypothetical protein [Legionella impletisoli]|uniref:Uncharacterized protein n=1 Tax=Legionella impletisoli TaxID=343510 RepID=A0A917JTW2_9GAMM|nr:hypothetical protein [Legionella impletisoli]GGI83947.1 hypothetical protein GCM10007966_10710 [Legionella impletisoli]